MREPGLAISDRPEAGRYEARFGDALVGVLEYRVVRARRILLHTEVSPAFAGRGIGAALARHALEATRAAAGARVVVRCPFIRGYLERHPEFADVVSPDPHARPRSVGSSGGAVSRSRARPGP